MRTHVFLLGAAACWCCLICAAPAAMTAGDGAVHTAGSAAYVFFSTICHQWDSHSFHLFGHKLPVCIRCCAIYFSFFAGIVLYPTIGKKIEARYGVRSMIIAAGAGMVIDVACSSLGIAESSTASRLVTGGAFGLLMAFVLTPTLHELIESFGHGPQ
jgi:uncharacterized membrane protein